MMVLYILFLCLNPDKTIKVMKREERGRRRFLHDSGSHPRTTIGSPAEEGLDNMGECETTGCLEVTTVTTDVGISLGVSPHQASVGLFCFKDTSKLLLVKIINDCALIGHS